MNLLKPTSKIMIGEHKTQVAFISAVLIRGENITYEIYWWSGSTRHESWVNAEEVQSENSDDVFSVKLRLS